MNAERSCEFAVTEVVATEKQQLSLALWQRCKNRPHTILFFGGGVKLLGRRCTPNHRQKALIPFAARLSPKFVEAQPHRGPVKPGFGLRRMRARSTPKSNERLDCELLSPSRIANDSRNDSRNTIEPGAEKRLDVQGHIRRGRRFEDNFAGCVHIHITTQAADL